MLLMTAIMVAVLSITSCSGALVKSEGMTLTDVTFKNYTLSFIIDNYTLHMMSDYYKLDMHLHIPMYDVVMSYYNFQPWNNKAQLTFMSDDILVIPKVVRYVDHGYYHIEALFMDVGVYKFYIRLECGAQDYMMIQRSEIPVEKSEARGVVNNFTIIVDTLRGTDPDHYCSSTHAFRGRFQIDKTFDFFDEVQHDGDITTTFLPYGCKLRDLTNATQVLTLLSNHHHLSTNEAVYRGILEHLYGPSAFRSENNSPVWLNNSLQYNTLKQWGRTRLRLFDMHGSNVRLSYMFDGAPFIIGDWNGAVSDNFTVTKKWEYFRSELRRIVAESVNQCKTIVLLFNSGLHDIYSGRNLIKDDLYKNNLIASFLYLKSMVNEEKSKRINVLTCPDSAIESHFYWVSTTATVGSKICHGTMVRYLNEVASVTAKKYGFNELDLFSMITGKFRSI